MAAVQRTISAPADRVWEVLADGWRYPLWVVGASAMRAVDTSWPEVGSRLHHSVGSWPLLIHDSTQVLVSEPGRRLTIRARGWPLGEAEVDLQLQDDGVGTTTVVMTEEPSAGPGAVLFSALVDRVLAARNRESLRRLAGVVEARTDPA